MLDNNFIDFRMCRRRQKYLFEDKRKKCIFFVCSVLNESISYSDEYIYRKECDTLSQFEIYISFGLIVCVLRN